MRRLMSALFIGSCFSLVSCGTKDGIGDLNLPAPYAARSGLRVSSLLLGRDLKGEKEAATIGTLSSIYLSDPETIDIRVRRESLNDAERIAEAVRLLRVDVQQFLNRSKDRSEALEAYESALQTITAQCRERLVVLKDRKDTLGDEERDLKREVRRLERDVQESIRGELDRDAGSIIADLTKAEERLAEIGAGLAETTLFVESYKEVIDPLEDRLKAVNLNRDALIGGIRVQDVQGVEDLGILERMAGRRRR